MDFTAESVLSEKFLKGGGGVIFNPKIYIAKFGPLNRAFSAWKWSVYDFWLMYALLSRFTKLRFRIEQKSLHQKIGHKHLLPSSILCKNALSKKSNSIENIDKKECTHVHLIISSFGELSHFFPHKPGILSQRDSFDNFYIFGQFMTIFVT